MWFSAKHCQVGKTELRAEPDVRFGSKADICSAQGHCSAMEGLTSALAVELAPVRVNIVSPGVVKTPLWREMTGSARDALYAAEAQRLLVGHVGESQEIAEGYLYLIRQTYVTGQTLAIDGGRLLKFPQANNA